MVSGFWTLGFIRGVNPPLKFWITPTPPVLAIFLCFGLIPHHAAREYQPITHAEDLSAGELGHRFADLGQWPPNQSCNIFSAWRNVIDR